MKPSASTVDITRVDDLAIEKVRHLSQSARRVGKQKHLKIIVVEYNLALLLGLAPSLEDRNLFMS